MQQCSRCTAQGWHSYVFQFVFALCVVWQVSLHLRSGHGSPSASAPSQMMRMATRWSVPSSAIEHSRREGVSCPGRPANGNRSCGDVPHLVCLCASPVRPERLSERRERPQGASMYGDGVKYPHTVSEYWIQAGASMRILNTGLARYPKSIRVSMRLPVMSCVRSLQLLTID